MLLNCYVDPQAVENLKYLMQKMGITNRSEAVRQALRLAADVIRKANTAEQTRS